jgi:hypothetical protein
MDEITSDDIRPYVGERAIVEIRSELERDVFLRDVEKFVKGRVTGVLLVAILEDSEKFPSISALVGDLSVDDLHEIADRSQETLYLCARAVIDKKTREMRGGCGRDTRR